GINRVPWREAGGSEFSHLASATNGTHSRTYQRRLRFFFLQIITISFPINNAARAASLKLLTFTWPFHSHRRSESHRPFTKVNFRFARHRGETRFGYSKHMARARSQETQGARTALL